MRWLVAPAFVLAACATSEFRPLVGAYRDAETGATYTFAQSGDATVRYPQPVVTPAIA